MTIRYFCDACGGETAGNNDLGECKVLNKGGVLVATFGISTVHFSQALASQRSDLHVCRYCLVDAATRSDDRPREAPKPGAPT